LSTPTPDSITLPAPVAPPFDFDLTLSAHGRFPHEAVNRYSPGRFTRAFWLNGRPVVARLQPGDPAQHPLRLVTVTVTGAHLTGDELEHVLERMSFMFGLQEDQSAFRSHVQGDIVLSELVQRYRGLHPVRSPNLHEMLVGAIIAQQITLSFAALVRERMVQKYGHTVTHEETTLWTFPAAEVLAEATIQDLMSLQFSRRKAEYIIDLSRAISSGAIDENALRALPDEAVVERLMQQRGLGLWTAQWALIRAFGRPDSVPAGDIGVRRAVGIFYQVNEGTSPKAAAEQVAQVAQGWRPFRSLATHYLLTAMRRPDL
jgi:DNA-3-methyladenine glycosylase II